jgi:hypothetical protein
VNNRERVTVKPSWETAKAPPFGGAFVVVRREVRNRIGVLVG